MVKIDEKFYLFKIDKYRGMALPIFYLNSERFRQQDMIILLQESFKN